MISFEICDFFFHNFHGLLSFFAPQKRLSKDTLIGRHVKDEKDMIRFELLTPEEDKVVIPKLEEICQEDLKANGLSFPSSNSEDATASIQ